MKSSKDNLKYLPLKLNNALIYWRKRKIKKELTFQLYKNHICLCF